MFSGMLHGTMDMINCREMFAEFYVDPTAAQQNVPRGYELLIHKNGKAMLLILVQDSQKCILNGLIRVSPMRMTQIWIELVGPDEVGPPLPGTTSSLPTRYWYTLPHQMDSTRAHFAFRSMGFDTQLVKEITLGGKPGGMRQGKVIEKDPLVKYRWTETSQLWPTPNLVTGRQRFYRQYGELIKRKSEGIVTCRSNFLGDGQIVLSADPDSAVGSLGFGTELRGATKSVEINCRVEIRYAANGFQKAQ